MQALARAGVGSPSSETPLRAVRVRGISGPAMDLSADVLACHHAQPWPAVEAARITYGC